MAEDTLHLGDVHVKNQLFQEASDVTGGFYFWDDMRVIRGIVSLTPSTAGSVQSIPSPFLTAASQGILDANMFSLRLAEPQEMTVGGMNRDLFTGDLTRIPVTNRTSDYSLSGRWQTDAHFVAIGSDPGIRLSLEDVTTSFTTAETFMSLPDPIVQELIEYLGFEEIFLLSPSVPCERRDIMPDVTLNLAGHNLTLSPYLYTFEFPLEGGAVRCISNFMPMGIDPANREMRLGTSFLRAFYTVFDLDTWTIGCELFVPLMSFAFTSFSCGCLL